MSVGSLCDILAVNGDTGSDRLSVCIPAEGPRAIPLSFMLAAPVKITTPHCTHNTSLCGFHLNLGVRRQIKRWTKLGMGTCLFVPCPIHVRRGRRGLTLPSPPRPLTSRSMPLKELVNLAGTSDYFNDNRASPVRERKGFGDFQRKADETGTWRRF